MPTTRLAGRGEEQTKGREELTLFGPKLELSHLSFETKCSFSHKKLEGEGKEMTNKGGSNCLAERVAAT